MKVNIKLIESAVLEVLTQIKHLKGNEFELKHDLYWDIPFEELYDPNQEPKSLTMGQVSEDIDFVALAMKEDILVPYYLKKIAAILTAISAEYT